MIQPQLLLVWGFVVVVVVCFCFCVCVFCCCFFLGGGWGFCFVFWKGGKGEGEGGWQLCYRNAVHVVVRLPPKETVSICPISSA